MKTVVIGGTGLIGSRLITKLLEHGHEAISASPSSGVNTLTGEGLAAVLAGAHVVVDVSNSASFADNQVMNFFTTSTSNVLAAEKTAGVTHHITLSIVGADVRLDSGYMRAKVAQEKLVKDSPIPYSLVRATQFYEFAKSIADAATDGSTVRLSHALVRPIAADDVAIALARTAVGSPLNDTLEIAGPDEIGLDDFVRRALAKLGDPRKVDVDAEAPYFGAILTERTLIPGPDAVIFDLTFDQWLVGQGTPAK